MAYDSRPDTEAHIARVQELLYDVFENLNARSERHDRSKLASPEKEMLDSAVTRLNEVEYRTPEYNAAKEQLGLGLVHHYAHNSHHPEHYAQTTVLRDPEGNVVATSWKTDDGVAVSRMSLLDVIEMLVDWKAATERMQDGDIGKSITINTDRFGLSDQLASILRHTAIELGWMD